MEIALHKLFPQRFYSICRSSALFILFESFIVYLLAKFDAKNNDQLVIWIWNENYENLRDKVTSALVFMFMTLFILDEPFTDITVALCRNLVSFRVFGYTTSSFFGYFCFENDQKSWSLTFTHIIKSCKTVLNCIKLLCAFSENKSQPTKRTQKMRE